ELMTQLKDLNDNFHGDNGLKYDKIGEIENQDWYKDEQTGAFAQKIEDDPFFHLAGSASVSESQVVLGDDENFVSYSDSVLSSSTDITIEEGAYAEETKFSVINQETEFEVGDNFSGTFNTGLLGAEKNVN